MLRETGLRDALVLLSICQTCRYKDVSFLHFLRSKARDVAMFCERKHRKGAASAIELSLQRFYASAPGQLAQEAVGAPRKPIII